MSKFNQLDKQLDKQLDNQLKEWNLTDIYKHLENGSADELEWFLSKRLTKLVNDSKSSDTEERTDALKKLTD